MSFSSPVANVITELEMKAYQNFSSLHSSSINCASSGGPVVIPAGLQQHVSSVPDMVFRQF